MEEWIPCLCKLAAKTERSSPYIPMPFELRPGEDEMGQDLSMEQGEISLSETDEEDSGRSPSFDQ